MSARSEYVFVAGHAALDLANTVAPRGQAGRWRDLLPTGDRAIAWFEEAGARHLLPPWPAHCGVRLREDGGAVRALRRLRDALHEVFVALARGDAPPAAGLALLNRLLRRGHAARRLQGTAGAVAWRFAPATPVIVEATFPLLVLAAELLAGPHASCVRQCSGPECGRLFLDLSPTRRRRWCRMGDCGNRAKARRHHRRRVASTTAAGAGADTPGA